jgi:hypothetical protein
MSTEKFAAWLWTYSRGKPISNFAGNFWGVSRKRCTIIPAARIEELAAAGLIVRNGSSFVVVKPI